MNVHEQIKAYIATQPEPKRSDMHELHGIILGLMPDCTLWFLDGKDEQGQTVSNPNIGYGFQTIRYADGKTREFYQIGISANTAGISVYILGIEDKKYLAETYGKKLGKASVTGYCIKFKTLKDVNNEFFKLQYDMGLSRQASSSVFNLTYLAVTARASARLAPTKTQVKTALCRRMESISFVSIGRDLAMCEGDKVTNGMGGTRAVG